MKKVTLFVALLTVSIVGVAKLASAIDSTATLLVQSSVSAGQQDVPVYIELNSSGSNISFIGCEISTNSSFATFSHFGSSNGGFSSDFNGPIGTFNTGGANDTSFYASNGSGSPVEGSPSIKVIVVYYDISPLATGSISFDLNTGSMADCQVQDEGSNSYSLTTTGAVTTAVSGVSVSESDGSTQVSENGTNDSFSLSLNAKPETDVTINLASSGQITLNTNSVTFNTANWSTPVNITITATDDSIIEGVHTASVELSIDNTSDSTYLSLSLDDVSVQINDNDGLSAQFKSTSTSADENGIQNIATVLVSGADTTISGAESVDVSVSGGTAVDGSDYNFSTPQTITIPAADYTTPTEISVPGFSIIADDTVEDDETVLFSLNSPSFGVAIGTVSSATHTITNDDSLLVEFLGSTVLSAESDQDIPKLIISGNSDISTSVSMSDLGTGSSTPGQDYTFSTPSLLTIPAGNYDGTTSSSVDTAVIINDDKNIEPNETAVFKLATVGSGVEIDDVDNSLSTEDISTLTIVDDDILNVEFNITASSSPEASGISKPTILVGGAITNTIKTIDVSIVGGSATHSVDYTFNEPTTVSIPAGSYLTPVEISVPSLNIIDDTDAENDETIQFILQDPSSDVQIADVDSVNGVENNYLYTIVNDDIAPLIDSDGDGLPDEIENSGINNGDSNGDGILDSTQINVATFYNGITGNNQTIEVSDKCKAVSDLKVIKEESLTSVDNQYEFPYGMYAFSLTCANPGETAVVRILFSNVNDSENWILRKSSNGVYRSVETATFSMQSIGDVDVSTVTYNVTDGGILDEDNVANGVILDPIGIARPTALRKDLAVTGQRVVLGLFTGIMILSCTRLIVMKTSFPIYKDKQIARR